MLRPEELGKKLTEAGRLKLRPLCVYGTDEIPEGAVPSYTVDRCVAKAVYISAALVDWYGLDSQNRIQNLSTS